LASDRLHYSWLPLLEGIIQSRIQTFFQESRKRYFCFRPMFLLGSSDDSALLRRYLSTRVQSSRMTVFAAQSRIDSDSVRRNILAPIPQKISPPRGDPCRACSLALVNPNGCDKGLQTRRRSHTLLHGALH